MLTLGSQGSHGIRDILRGLVLENTAEGQARDHPRCRRRLRHQGLPYREYALAAVAAKLRNAV